MGRTALSHRSVVQRGQYPPKELLEPLVERTDNHWYWLGEFYDDNVDRCAEYAWYLDGCLAGRYSVPKLLWSYEHPELNSTKLVIENVCGLYTCINPSHWKRRVASVIPTRIVLPEGLDAAPAQDRVNSTVVHVVYTDSSAYLCGWRGAGCRRLDAGTPVTCNACIVAWFRRSKPYIVPE